MRIPGSIRLFFAAAAALMIAHVAQAQTVKVYYVPWNATDAYQNIYDTIEKARIAGGPSKIILTRQATPWYISQPVELYVDNMQIWFANAGTGTVPFLKAKAGGNFGPTSPLFRVTGSNVRINGYHNGIDASGGRAILEMQKAEYMAIPEDERGESRHCINIRGAANTTLQGLILQKSGGDGVAINPKSDSPSTPAYNVVMTDVTCHDNYRNGLAVISVDTLTATNCVFQNTGESGVNPDGPGAGVDIEPSVSVASLKAVKFVNCQFLSNRGNNVKIDFRVLTNASPSVDIRFESCIVDGWQPLSGSQPNGMYFVALAPPPIAPFDPPYGPIGTIVVKDTIIRNSAKAGLRFSSWAADRVPITMANVDLVSCNTAGDSPLILWTTDTATDRVHGDVIFQSGCHIDDTAVSNGYRSTSMVYVGGNVRVPGVKDITGSITVTRPPTSTRPLLALGTNTTNCTLAVTDGP